MSSTALNGRKAGGTDDGEVGGGPGSENGRGGGRRLRVRALRLLLWLIAQLLILVLVVLALVLGTQTGLRVAVAVAEDLAPDVIAVGHAEGRVLGALRITGIRLDLPGLELDLGRLYLDWRPAALFGGRLELVELTVADVAIAVEPGPKKAPEPFELPQIDLPIGVEIGRVLVERLSFTEKGAPPESAIRLERAELSATAVGDRLELRRLDARLAQPAAEAGATGSARLTGDYPLSLDLGWRFEQAPALRLTGTGTVGGDLALLEVEHRVSGSAELVLEAQIRSVLDAPRWEGRILLSAVRLPEIVDGAPAVDVAGEIRTAGGPNDATLTGRLLGTAPDLPDFGELQAELDIGWAAKVLAVRALHLGEADSGARLNVAGTLDLSGRQPTFAFAGFWERLRWPLAGAAVAEVPTGRLDVGGDLDAFAYSMTAAASGPQLPQMRLALSGSGDTSGTDLTSLSIEALGGHIEAKGRAQWSPALSWDLALVASEIDPGVHYAGLDGRLALNAESSGGIDDGYRFRVKVDADLSAYPETVLNLVGSGGAERAEFESLSIEALGGLAEGSAWLAWAPTLRWDLSLDAEDLDPGRQYPGLDGRIALKLRSSGETTEAGLAMEARVEELAGELRGYPVRVQADVAVSEGFVALSRLLAESGTTRLSADGRLALPVAAGAAGTEAPEAAPADFRFELDSPDLAAVLPGAGGSLSADGTLGGTLSAPAVSVRLEGRDVDLAGQGIERIAARANVDLGTGGAVALDVDGENLLAGGQRFAALRVNGEGSIGSHRLAASLEGDALSLSLGAEGALEEGGSYRGALERLVLTSEGFGVWELQQRAGYSLDKDRISVGPVCIGNGAESGGCAELRQPRSGELEARLDVPRIGLEVLSPLLPEAIVMDGFARADASFRRAGEALSGSARVQLPAGKIGVALGKAKDELVFSGTGADLSVDDSGLTAELAVPLQEVGRIDGKVSLPGFGTPGGGDPALRGDVAVRLDGLARVARLVPDVTDVTGSIDGDVRLAGTLGQPQVSARLAVRDLGLTVPLIGLELAQTSLTVESQSASLLTVDGSALVGGGRLDIDGTAQIADQGPSVKVDVRGDRLKVADSKEYFALIGVDLQAGAGPGGAALRGEIKVPEARIMPRTIPSGAIQPSPDVVLEEAAVKEPVPLHIDILARLGDAVSIDAFGLRARLRGDLRVTKAPQKGLIGDGQLEVVEGTYRVTLPGEKLITAIGKPLTIEQGIVAFAKTPIDNPRLILKAQREGGDLTAGVRVLGTIKSPKLAFFSESDPDLTQSEVASYLVTGVPPKRGAEADSRALSVGTYVTPKLFVEYENSLGEQADKVKMRYELTKQIELQSETGDSQGADIFYKFEN